jgi:hypothetical protein
VPKKILQMQELWRISLFGGLKAERDGVTITRFRMQKTAALFAYLTLFLDRTHPREELTERFWPEGDVPAGHSSLRTALASLRRQFEPPGVPAGTVPLADAMNVRLNPVVVEQPLHDRNIATIRAALGESGFAAGWTHGNTMTREHVFAYALASAHPDQSRSGIRNE